jgi:hypothetical protein
LAELLIDLEDEVGEVVRLRLVESPRREVGEYECLAEARASRRR